eukprot:GHVH01004128.1.p1 GENE.GHVH01004128.1~~GHVH01004128.1.p1  ORF type:complete len:184 (+),score=15.42 GHVH01004128.1:91-642(+)
MDSNNTCFLCLGDKSTASNLLSRSCSICTGAWVHQRCWRRWYQQQRMSTIKKMMMDMAPLSRFRMPTKAELCPICRTGKIRTDDATVEAMNHSFGALEDLQSRLYRVVLIAMEYVHSIRNTGNMNSELFKLDSFIRHSVKKTMFWIIVLILVELAVRYPSIVNEWHWPDVFFCVNYLAWIRGL